MKALLIVIFLSMSGCATGIESLMSGEQSKNSGPMRIERLGAMTSTDIAAVRPCRKTQIKVCTTDDAREDCGCMFVDDVQRQVQSLVRQRPRNGRP